MRERSRARGWALQVLYAWESRGRENSPRAILAEFEEERRVSRASREYLETLVRTVAEHIDEIDRAVEEALTNWRLERLSVIDRNILRLAAAEMLYLEDVPPRVSMSISICGRWQVDTAGRSPPESRTICVDWRLTCCVGICRG